MQSRLDRYDIEEKKKYERTKKNTELYTEVYDDLYRNASYKNMEVIDTAKEIDLGKLKDMISDNYDTRQYRTLKNFSKEDIENFDKPFNYNGENKSHDINEIINEAKSKRSFMEEAREKQKFIDFSRKRNSRYEKELDAMKKEEEQLEELINTMVVKTADDTAEDAFDLLPDLRGNEDTIVTNPIETTFDVDTTSTGSFTNDIEKTLVKADKTFYTDSNMFTKNDFEDFSTLERQLSAKDSKKTAIIITIITFVLAACIYIIMTKYIMK